MIFVDTSAFLAILHAGDRFQRRAELCLRSLRAEGQTLFTNNYILIESIALIQNRLGLEKVRQYQEVIAPLLDITWIDERQHEAAIHAVLRANRRNLSLVDCSAFETMRRLGIETAFTFDRNFQEEGFKVIP